MTNPLPPDDPRVRALVESLAELTEALSDDDLLAAVRASGEDPDAIAQQVRALLRRLIDAHGGTP